jgi:hypothetical protein
MCPWTAQLSSSSPPSLSVIIRLVRVTLSPSTRLGPDELTALLGAGGIFALGAVLFEMIAGRRAFEGDTQASLMGAILRDIPPPVRRRSALPTPGCASTAR